MAALLLLLLLLLPLAQADPPRCEEPEAFMAKFFMLDPSWARLELLAIFFCVQNPPHAHAPC